MNKVVKILTDNILNQLKNGVAPWRKPWNTLEPANAVSGKCYSGVNYLLLGEGHYMTFKQIKDLGGMVKQGSKSYQIAWYGSFTPKKDNDEKKSIPVLRYYNVFNVNDTTGLPEKFYNLMRVIDFVPQEKAEEIIKRLNPVIKYVEGKAYFRPSENFINMPNPETFHSIEEYYCTLFHELIHWTKQNGIERKNDYAHEELVAEIGAHTLMHKLGFKTNLDNATAYCAGWASKAKDLDIIKSASQAYKAVEFILG